MKSLGATVFAVAPETSRSGKKVEFRSGEIDSLGDKKCSQKCSQHSSLLHQYHCTHKTVNATPLVMIIQRYPDIFKELGELRNYRTALRVNPNTKPIFCKARHVPFALQEELDWLESLGIIKPIQNGQPQLLQSLKQTNQFDRSMWGTTR